MRTIYNTPDYANEYKYIVASDCDDDLWFYGAYNDKSKAYSVANEIDGVVVENN